MANKDLGRFGPWSIRTSTTGRFGPHKTRSELTILFLKIGSELATVRIDFRSELTKVQPKVRPKFTQIRIELRSEDLLKTMFRHLSFRHKFLNTLKNIDVEIDVLFLLFFTYFCVAFSWLFQ